MRMAPFRARPRWRWRQARWRIRGADIALSVTGIAGPGGGSAEKPVGLVWFGLRHGRDGQPIAERRHVFEDRGRGLHPRESP